MRRLLLLLLCLPLIAGCPGQKPASVRPVPAQCEASCFVPCVDAAGDTGVRWEADPADPAAWDALGEDVTDRLATKLRTCDTRRQACVQCLERLEHAEVIVR